MRIWVDADACPAVIRKVLFKAAVRTGIRVTFVANRAVDIPRSPLIEMLQVGAGLDVADNEIVRRLRAGDLVITADIPLAAEVIEKGGYALNPRGTFYTKENVRACLNMRDFLETLRAGGTDTGGPAALSQQDRKAFADHLDRFLTGGAGKV